MFANIPNHKLRQAQEKVHRMKENPVFYLLHSLTKLHAQKGFYPGLDIQRLYKILTTEQSLGLLNPGLGGGQEEQQERRQPGRKEDGDRYQVHMRRQREEREAEEKRTKEEEREQGKPLVDLTAEMKRIDEPRLKLLLDFFIEHFIHMSEKSSKFKNHGQGYMYLRSAENLITLVEEMNYHCGEHRQQVIKLRENVNYSLYIKDYWAISYGHPRLGASSSLARQPSTNLPSLPPTPTPPPNSNIRPEFVKPEKKQKKKKVKITVSADVHDTDSETYPPSQKLRLRPEFEVTESSDFDSEFTHL